MPDSTTQPAQSEPVLKCGCCGGSIPLEPSGGGMGFCGCLNALQSFKDAMRHELVANKDKGGRYLWTADPPQGLLAAVADHYAKLHVAARELERRRAGVEPRSLPWGDRPAEEMVLEFAADTANMAFMLADAFGLLDDAGATGRRA